MPRRQPILIMIMGKTHSGKTTLGRNLKRLLSDSVMIDSDQITIFLRAAQLPFVHEKTGPYPESALKLKILETIFRFFLKRKQNLILTSSNILLKKRNRIFSLARRNNYKRILIFLDFPDEVLRKRIQIARKSNVVNTRSKSFYGVLVKQNRSIDLPKAQEAEYYFRIDKTNSLKDLKNLLAKL